MCRQKSIPAMTRQVLSFLLLAGCCRGKVVVFWQEGFPTIESQPVPQATLSKALRQPVFADTGELAQSLKDADLLVLPYGSAVPVDAWKPIADHLRAGGSLLALGGRPLFVPVKRQDGKFVAGRPQNTYARQLGLFHSYAAPQMDLSRFTWAEEYPSFRQAAPVTRKVWVSAMGEDAGDYRGLGFFLNEHNDPIAAPVTREDFQSAPMMGSRVVFLNFEPAAGFWSSQAGVDLVRDAAEYAARGSTLLWVEMQQAIVDQDQGPEFVVHLRNARRQRLGQPQRGMVRVELISEGKTVATKEIQCGGDTVAAAASFTNRPPPGLHVIKATYIDDGQAEEVYQTGFWSGDTKRTLRGPALSAGRDYFQKDGKPFLPLGTNYFSTDFYAAGFKAGGNAFVWERDFTEMEKHHVNFVRTGVWSNQADILNEVTGGVDERFLRSLEAFLLSAGRHNVHVEFTLCAFNPQGVRHRNEEATELGPGTNSYTDPVALRAQLNYVLSIVNRFRNVPYLSWDLINEPSYSDPHRLWHTVPTGDATETAAWNKWLAAHYRDTGELADAWSVQPEELGILGAIPMPAAEDLTLRRYGSARQARAIDFNLFAQASFNQWVASMITAIRSTGSSQLVTVGQDEGGVTDRLLNQFYGGAGVDFTVMHTWWLDDALLWSSVAAKRPGLPNLIGETGVQPVWRPDGQWRYDEVTTLGLLERKLALGFAAANAGSLQWDWGRSDDFGIHRSDGSDKLGVEIVSKLGEFAEEAAPYAGGMRLPDVAIVLPQSLQLSVFNRFALEAQQKSVRALFHYARASAYAVGEYQIELLGDPKLIILPSPWLLSQHAWESILEKVRSGATLLLTGRFDADEHFRAQPRARDLGFEYQAGLLRSRENTVEWPGHTAQFSYSGDKCTYLDRGFLPSGRIFIDQPVGKGKVLYFALPLELADEVDAVGDVYRFALDQAKARAVYTTATQDPGILICPTELESATLYVLTSESGVARTVTFRDVTSGRDLSIPLDPGRAALVLIRHNGEVAARYP